VVGVAIARRWPFLPQFRDSADEPAQQRRAHDGRGHEHDRVEDRIDDEVDEGLNAFIVDRSDFELDGAAGCSRCGVFPNVATRLRSH